MARLDIRKALTLILAMEGKIPQSTFASFYLIISKTVEYMATY